jgi:hypothetical protein
MFIYQRSNNRYSKQAWPNKSSATRTDFQASRLPSIYQAARFAPEDATKLLAISSLGFGGYLKYQISGTCAINYLAPIDLFSHGIFGILILIIQHLFQLLRMHIYN